MIRPAFVLSAILVLTCLATAGCTSSATAHTLLVVEFAGHGTDRTDTVASDLASRPTASTSRANGIPHPDGYTAHDQLEDWSHATHRTYEAKSFNSSFGAGYFLTAIDGVAADGTTAYWSLSINGKASDVGMSDAILHDGDSVTWTFTAVEATPANSTSSSSSLGLTLDPPVPTTGEAVTLAGTVAKDSTVSVRGGPSVQAKKGAWTLQVPVPFGQSKVQVVADDGTDSSTLDATLVRLASFTFEVQYGHYPGLTDAKTDLWMDIDSFPSAPAYEGKSAPHPDFANVHDVTTLWAATSGATVEVAWSESLQGYSMSKINGAGNPLDSSAPPYWVLEVNGATADFGMTLMPVAPGDHVAWCLNACGI